MTEDTKTCTKCKQTRLVSEFNKDKSRADGRFPQCKICAKADKAVRKDKIKDYNAQYKKEHASEISESRKKYYQEHGEKERSDRRAYYQENRDKERASGEAYRRAHGIKPASENIDCSLFLGTHITERAVRPVLPNAIHMPPSHPKYDYLCSQGYKIDVKSATTYYYDLKNAYRWMFKINHNEEADYFLCVAYDNRTELNIIKMWMIPGSKINHLGHLSISPGSFAKWSQYELDPNETSNCVKEITGEPISP